MRVLYDMETNDPDDFLHYKGNEEQTSLRGPILLYLFQWIKRNFLEL